MPVTPRLHNQTVECSVSICDKPATGIGLCVMHKRRKELYGDPMKHGGRNRVPEQAPPIERFWSRVERAPSGCWLWQGVTANGYGVFKIDGVVTYTHRYSYETLVEPIPPGLFIDHLCMVRGCVNPSHLEPVTSATNTRRALAVIGDEHLKGRARQTHCVNGHLKTPENSDRDPKQGFRICLDCKRMTPEERAEAHRRRGLGRAS